MDTIEVNHIRTLLTVWAHPDDEAYLAAGLMLRVAEAGGRVVCVTATNGERGSDDPARWPPSRLGPHRVQELGAALAHLGVTETRLLGLPDGGCQQVPVEDGTAAVAAVIDEIRPDAIVTFGPDGITGHPDHVAVGRWATAAWRASQPAAPTTLLYATTTPAFVQRHARLHRRAGFFPTGYPRPSLAGDCVIDLELDCRELKRKRAALAAHASQTTELAGRIGERAFTHWWRTESFRRPRPVETDIETDIETDLEIAS